MTIFIIGSCAPGFDSFFFPPKFFIKINNHFKPSIKISMNNSKLFENILVIIPTPNAWNRHWEEDLVRLIPIVFRLVARSADRYGSREGSTQPGKFSLRYKLIPLGIGMEWGIALTKLYCFYYEKFLPFSSLKKGPSPLSFFRFFSYERDFCFKWALIFRGFRYFQMTKRLTGVYNVYKGYNPWTFGRCV